jgi:iron complex transport system substrate-binding protein
MRVTVATVILLVFAGSFLIKGLLVRPEARAVSGKPADCRRIVSMAPSITETLFALGLGDRVVGVTRFCTYPPEVADLPKIGGFQDPNYEAMVSLQTDLVVVLEEQPLGPFRELGLPTLVVRHKDVAGILDSISTLGRAFGVEDRAERLLADINSRLERVRQKTAGRPSPRALLVVGRNLDGDTLRDVCIAGADGHINKILSLAGGRNAYEQDYAPFPLVSCEGILQMNPEVIFDLVPPAPGKKHDHQSLLRAWQQVPQVEAVAKGRVYVIDEDYATIPGPRFILLVERLARLMHP